MPYHFRPRRKVDNHWVDGIQPMGGQQWVDGHTERGLGRLAQATARALRLGSADVVRVGAAQTN